MIYIDSIRSAAWSTYETLSDVQWWQHVYQKVCENQGVKRAWSVISSPRGRAWGAGIVGVCVAGVIAVGIARRWSSRAANAGQTGTQENKKEEPPEFKITDKPSEETKGCVRII
ncbi:MAG: hypothetical protein KDK50_03800 [Chlamydiia bacterium]|nr:hypothetical protein [Chlamydiia bacterium]